MLNADVIDLYSRVDLGTKIIVLQTKINEPNGRIAGTLNKGTMVSMWHYRESWLGASQLSEL